MAKASSPAVRLARHRILQARATARDGTERERVLADALYDWWRGRRKDALEKFVRLVRGDPADVEVVTWASYIACAEGDVSTLQEVAGALTSARPRLPFGMALRAFALAQVGLDDEAFDCGQRALAIDAHQSLAQMVVSEHHARSGNPLAGIQILERGKARWRGRFWRHALLCRLARLYVLAGQADDAFALVDSHLMPAAEADPLVLQGTISLLWLAEMEGVDVGDRWRIVGGLVEARWHEHILPLIDVFFIYALARDGRDQAMRAFFASMERVGEADNSGLWQSLVIPLARGLVLLANDDRACSHSVLEPLMVRLQLLGGCRGERDVILRAIEHATTRPGGRRKVVSVHRPAEMPVAP
jgi:hypothetical protein